MLRKRDAYVKVLDFGLVKLIEQPPAIVDTEAPTKTLFKTEEGVVMGTVTYMSPEQARGLEVDARADIWSLGVVCCMRWSPDACRLRVQRQAKYWLRY